MSSPAEAQSANPSEAIGRAQSLPRVDSPPTTTLASEWGYCPVCDGISYRGARCCRPPLPLSVINEAVDWIEISRQIRWVVAARESDPTDHGSDVLVIRVSDDAGRNQWAHAEAVAMILSLRISEFGQDVLRSTTLTGPRVQEQMAVFGVEVDRKTAYNLTQDLVAAGQLTRTGEHLPDRVEYDLERDEEVVKRGAVLYAIEVVRRTLGDLHAAWSPFGVWSLCNPDFPTRGIRRARGYLEWALREVKAGEKGSGRHPHLLRLACRCREWGVPPAEAVELVEDFQKRVPQAGLRRDWYEDGVRALLWAYGR